MRISLRLIAGCAAVIAILGGAQALARWHGAPLGQGHAWTRACAPSPGRDMASALPYLQSMLAITQAQRSAWDALAEAMREAEIAWRESCRDAASPASTTPEMFARLVAATDSASRTLRAVEPRLNDLYAALNDRQRQQLNDLLASRMRP